MSDSAKSHTPQKHFNRREFIKRSAVAAAFPAISAEAKTEGREARSSSGKKGRPNVIIIISDQCRWDALGAYGLNPMRLTHNLDAMARRGILFQSHITNQPVCAPSRACLMTGQYQNRHGVWHNGLGLSPDAVTIATSFRQAGYSANYIGKWHLMPNSGNQPETLRAVPPDRRGGFLDFWEASNVLEFTSHPYEGEIYDAEGKPIRFDGIYRVDFLTERTVRFLRQFARQPFLLVVSYVEPHFQNDWNRFVAPKGYAQRYANPFVPEDLRFFPGDWPSQLPDYYGCIARVDESVGTVLKTLSELGMEDDTIVMFVSDHGCHFRTRNSEYKRSPHESSIHVPLVIQGPGFNRSLVVPELTAQVDVTPSLLDAVGIPIPKTMQGKSFMPLLERDVEGWANEVYIQVSESETGRALRTPEWTYAVVDSDPKAVLKPASDRYEEYQMYDLFADPHELVNLAGRADLTGGEKYRAIADHLSERLLDRMVEVGEDGARIQKRRLYP